MPAQPSRRLLIRPVLLLLFALLPACNPDGGGDSGGQGDSSGRENGDGQRSTARRKQLLDPAWVQAEAQRLKSRKRDVALAALLLEVADAQGDRTADVLASVALAYHRAGAYVDAERFAREAIAKGQAGVGVKAVLADCLRESAREEEASEVLESIDDHNAASLLCLARIAFRDGRVDRALECFELFYDRAEQERIEASTVAVIEHARALRRAKRYREASNALLERLEKEPWQADLYSELATTQYRLKKRQSGKYFEQVFKRLNENAFDREVQRKLRAQGREDLALSQEALNLESQGRFAEALSTHRAAAETTRDPRVIRYYVEFLQGLELHREALQVLGERLASGLKPASGLWLDRAKMERRAGKLDAAASALTNATQALAVETETGVDRGQAHRDEVSIEKARVLIAQGEFVHADSEVAALLSPLDGQSASPFQVDARFVASQSAVKRGDHEQALSLLDSVSQAYRGQSDWHRARSKALFEQGQGLAALQELQFVARNSTVSSELVAEMIALVKTPADRQKLELQKESIEAVERRAATLRRELNPNAPDAAAKLYALARIYAQLKDPRAQRLLTFAAQLKSADLSVLKAAAQTRRRADEMFLRMYLMRQVAAKAPEDAEALETFVRVYTRLELRPMQAVRDAERLSKLRPSAATSILYATAATQAGDQARAKSILEQALVAFPKEAASLQTKLDELKAP